VPTTVGILLFGRERLDRFPDAYLQAGRFAGAGRANLADRAELTAYPVLAIEQAVGFVERNTRLGMTIDRVRRHDLPAVPPAAVREELVNAIAHADYAQRGAPIRVAVFDDRIEVENPGILLPGLTMDDPLDGVGVELALPDGEVEQCADRALVAMDRARRYRSVEAWVAESPP
jgi:predicted HTH transcriptional regulator